MFRRLFIDHPNSIDESYREHLAVAAGFGGELLKAGLACLVHAVIPGLFVTTGSDAIRKLHADMVTNRRRNECRDKTETILQ